MAATVNEKEDMSISIKRDNEMNNDDQEVTLGG